VKQANTQAPGGNGEAQSPASFFPLDRFNAFSDGVLAIVITLLVLELPVPPADAPVLPLFSENSVDFLGYFISFAFVGGIWLSHATLTKSMKRGDTVTLRLNLALLLFVALLPYTTHLMVLHMTGQDARAAVAIYGLNLFMAGLLLTVLLSHVARDRRLVVDDLADDRISSAFRQRRIYLSVNAVAVIVGLLAPLVAVGAYVLLSIAFIIQPLIGIWRKH
jgi:uncharacterized membrane protein